MTEPQTADGLDRWSRRAGTPLLVLAALFSVVFVVLPYQPDLPAREVRAFAVINVLVWLTFTSDSWRVHRGGCEHQRAALSAASGATATTRPLAVVAGGRRPALETAESGRYTRCVL